MCVWYGWFVLNRSATNRNTSKALGRLRSRGSLCASLTAFAAVLASPCFPEPASPFQSARDSPLESRVLVD